MVRLRKELQLIIDDLRPRFPDLSANFAFRNFVGVKAMRVFRYNGASIGVDPKNMIRKTYIDTAGDNLDFIGFDRDFKTKFLDWCQAQIAAHRAPANRAKYTTRDDAKEDLRQLAEYFFREMRGKRLKAVLASSRKKITRITPHTAAKVTALLFKETYPFRMSMTEANLKKIFDEYLDRIDAE
jgi:hypothetical protein